MVGLHTHPPVGKPIGRLQCSQNGGKQLPDD